MVGSDKSMELLEEYKEFYKIRNEIKPAYEKLLAIINGWNDLPEEFMNNKRIGTTYIGLLHIACRLEDIDREFELIPVVDVED